jgi:hypothetical protein
MQYVVSKKRKRSISITPCFLTVSLPLRVSSCLLLEDAIQKALDLAFQDRTKVARRLLCFLDTNRDEMPGPELDPCIAQFERRNNAF